MNGDHGALPAVLRSHAVLFVDDEEGNRTVFELAFRRHFDVLTAGSGAEALEVLARERVDVLVTDHRMPGMTGVELCARVRRAYPHVRRILVTAYTDLETATGAINEGGVHHYVTKPWNRVELRLLIENALNEAVVARASRVLQATMLLKERMSALAAARGRILHDLANSSLVLSVTCSNLIEAVERHRDLLPAELVEEMLTELRDQRTAVEHLQQLHQRVRDMDAHPEVEPTEQPVRQVFQTVLALTRGRFPYGTTAEVDCPPGATVYADPTDLVRILVNLVVNAVESMREAGTPEPRVRLAARPHGDTVDILVSDSGPGIPEELRDRIFDDLFTTRRNRGGSGMGLAICLELAEANEGSLEIECTGPEGTTFRLRFRARAPGRTHALAAPSGRAPAGAGSRPLE